MRIRTWAAAACAAVAGAAFVPTTAVHAAVPYPPFVAVTHCDDVTNTITVSTANGRGTFVPKVPVKVEFQSTGGSYVSTGGTTNVVPPGAKTTVAAVTGVDGGLTAHGFTRAWSAASYVFYTETFRATVLNHLNQVVTTRYGTCTRDLRTVVTMTCDSAQEKTTTGRAAGSGYGSSAIKVEYVSTVTGQRSADSPGFIKHPNGTPDFVHRLTPTAGAWTDTAFDSPESGEWYYKSYLLDVTVSSWVSTLGRDVIIGRGSAFCEYPAPTR